MAATHRRASFVFSHIDIKELRAKDYQLGGRPPSYPLKPEFCGVSLAPERHSLFDIEKPSHPNEIEESHSPPLHLNDLWYDDGSVVLKAGNDFFRVHGSILSQKSSVFATILLQSQIENTETHEGCPVVALGDDAEELRQLLLTIYEISYALRPQRSVASTDLLSQVLRGQRAILRLFMRRSSSQHEI